MNRKVIFLMAAISCVASTASYSACDSKFRSQVNTVITKSVYDGDLSKPFEPPLSGVYLDFVKVNNDGTCQFKITDFWAYLEPDQNEKCEDLVSKLNQAFRDAFTTGDIYKALGTVKMENEITYLEETQLGVCQFSGPTIDVTPPQ